MIKKNVILNYGSQAWVALMGVIFVPFYIRFLGEEAYGLIGFFTAVSILLHTISMGIVPTLTREMTKIGNGSGVEQEILDLKFSFELFAIIGALSIAGIFFILSELIATDWLKPEKISFETVAYSIQLMGVIISTRLVEAIYRSTLIGLGQISAFASVTAVMATIRGVGAILVLYLSHGDILAFFGWNLATTLLTLISLKFLVTQKLRPLNLQGKFNLSSMTGIRQFAFGMMVVSISGSIYTQVDKFLLSSFMSLSGYGIYIIASNLAAIVFMAVSPLTQAIYPELSKFYFDAKNEEFRSLYIWSVKLVIILTGTLGFCFAFNAQDVLSIWTGNPEIDHDTELVFILLCISSIINSLSWIPQQAQFSIGLTSSTIKINTLCSAFLLILMFPIFTNFGVLGCAALLMMTNMIYLIFYLIITKQYFIQTGFSNFLTFEVGFPLVVCCLCLLTWKAIFGFVVVDLHIVIQLILSAITTVLFLLIVFKFLTNLKLSLIKIQ